MKRKRKLIAGILSVLLTLTIVAVVLLIVFNMNYSGGEEFANPKEINAEHQGKSVLVHMKSGLKPDDSQPCVAFNMALGLVASGYEVSILIDAKANADFLGQTPEKSRWGRYKLPGAMVEALSAQLDIPLEEFPKTYIGLMEWMADQGVPVYMNGTMNILTWKADKVLDQEKIPAFIQLVTYPQMAKLLAESERYIAY